MKIRSIILTLAIVLGIPILWGTCAYNEMVSSEQQVDAGWAQVENVLQRRADLIPNLVATVKGIAGQEQAVFTAVAEARGRLLGAQGPAEAAEADAALSSALGRLLAISERYPELRSSENFLSLQDELAGTENRIAVERRRYNELVRDYNVAIRRFPRRIFANLFGFEPREFFQAAPGAQEVPTVDFGTTQ
jgi:LemA protein